VRSLGALESSTIFGAVRSAKSFGSIRSWMLPASHRIALHTDGTRTDGQADQGRAERHCRGFGALLANHFGTLLWEDRVCLLHAPLTCAAHKMQRETHKMQPNIYMRTPPGHCSMFHSRFDPFCSMICPRHTQRVAQRNSRTDFRVGSIPTCTFATHAITALSCTGCCGCPRLDVQPTVPSEYWRLSANPTRTEWGGPQSMLSCGYTAGVL
jgi:hypothetical protein